MTDTFDVADVAWVTGKDDLRHMLSSIESAPVVSFDLETTGLDEHATTGGERNGGVAARIVMVSFTVRPGGPQRRATNWVLPLSHPESSWSGQWRKVMRVVAKRLRGKRLIAHNGKYDLRYTYAATGVDLSPYLHWDTMLSSGLLDENISKQLKERAPDTFGVPRWDDVDLKYPGAAEHEPMIKLGEYAARDTYWTLRLYEAHIERMIPDPDEPPMFPDELEDARLGLLMQNVSMPTVRALAGIEQRGIGLDVDWTYAQIAEEEAARDEAFETLTDLYPGHDRETASFAPTSNWFKAWAQTAVQQDDLRILSMTRGGSPKWSKDILNKLARKGFWVAETLLTYRTAVKRIEFLRSWLMHATGEPPRIHAQYNVGSVVTGRLSSSNPNMQQVSKALRPAFIPSPGHYLAELDYSQIELRVAAFISRCEPMLEAFRNGDDLHRLLAARITGKRPADVTKDERQKGKSANFGLLYDMSAEGYQKYAETAYGVELSLTEAKAAQHTFFEMWDGLSRWHSDARDRVHSRGQVMSPLGRVRRLDGVWSNDQYEVGQAQRAAINSPVQGMASDIMQIAVASIEGKMPGVEPVRGARIVGTVHDSIMVELPQGRWREVGEACQRVMEEGVPEVLKRMSCHLDVPLKADLEVGTRWGVSDILAE